MPDVTVDPFDALAHHVQASFAKNLALNRPVFQTDADLFQVYLDSFSDPAQRQFHNCSCCRSFLKRYGGLVTAGADGTVTPLMWAAAADLQGIPSEYGGTVVQLFQAVAKARIKRPFVSSDAAWGVAEAGGFHHFHVRPPTAMVHRRGVYTAGQVMAQKEQEFKSLVYGLRSYGHATFAKALALLQGGTLTRGDQFIGRAETYVVLKTLFDAQKDQRLRDAVLWHSVATAPKGTASVKAGVLGSLLDDIESGKYDDKALAKRFATAMSTYQMPTAAPSQGNIQRAEKIIADLDLQPAFARRYAALSEVIDKATWRPTDAPGYVPPAVAAPAAQPKPGFFSALAPAQAQTTPHAKGATLSWQALKAKMLQLRATALQLIVPSRDMPYGAITTAVDPAAPPLLAWDRDEARNPFSWYRWHAASAQDFGLLPASMVEVLAIVPTPSTWGGAHQLHEGDVLVLSGAQDMHASKAGSGLFPELLRGDLHEVRRTIDAYSQQTPLADAPEPVAAVGLVLRPHVKTHLSVRLHTKTSTLDFTVDRWS